jgi:hypothetical protein
VCSSDLGAPSTLAGSQSANKSSLLGTTVQGLADIFKAYVQTTATSRAIVFPAIIRLKDVSDFFAKLPMIKGATMTLYINTNQCLCKLAVVPPAIESVTAVGPPATTAGTLYASGSMVLTESPTILGGGGTCPFMVSSASIGQGLMNANAFATALPVASKAVLVGLSIVSNQFVSNGLTTVINAPIRSVRLYAPVYNMSAQQEQDYLSGNALRKISYEDIFQYQFNNNTGDFNILVSNGLPGLKSIVCIPLLQQIGNGNSTAGVAPYDGVKTCPSLLSPFSSTGGTPDPIAITNFNVQISGKNVFNDAEQYDFQAFSQQLAHSNQLNGGMTTGMSSGLIGEHEFSNLYRYYYVDASRGRPGETGVSRSIQVLGKVLSPASATVGVTLMIFASFTRHITVNVGTGLRTD